MSLFKYIPAAIFAIAGSALLYVNCSTNVAAFLKATDAMDVAQVVVVLSCIGALFSLFQARIMRSSVLAGVVTLLVIIGCTVQSVRLTADRIGKVEQETSQPTVDRNGRIARLDRRIASLRKVIADQTPVEARECARFKPARHKAEDWPNCFDARGAITAATSELPVRLAERNALGEIEDTSAYSDRLLGWVMGPMASKASAMTRPMMLAVLLELATNLSLIVAGLLTPISSTAQIATQIATQARPVTETAVADQMIDITPRVTPADPVIKLLRQRPRGLTNDDVALALGVSKSAASQRVTKLVEAGTVTRQRVGRVVQIKLTV